MNHVCTKTTEGLTRVSDPLELNLQALVSHHVDILSTTEPPLQLPKKEFLILA